MRECINTSSQADFYAVNYQPRRVTTPGGSPSYFVAALPAGSRPALFANGPAPCGYYPTAALTAAPTAKAA